MRVLVTGGREFAAPHLLSGKINTLCAEQTRVLYRSLDKIHSEMGTMSLGHGDARGVDRTAGLWAVSRGVEVAAYPVERGEDGFARNMRMLRQFSPDLVVAFPGGRGTAHMVATARVADVEVRYMPETEETLL